MFLTIVDVCLGRTNFDWTVCGKKTQTGQILNGAVFIFESILLIVVTVPLFKALLRLQAKNMKLTKEMKMFVIGDVGRACLFDISMGAREDL